MTQKNILFIRIHNSARSQMAEALLNQMCRDYFVAHSAGIEPGVLNPLAIDVMKEVGIDISRNHTKSVTDIRNSGLYFSYVITLCDETNAEGCPAFPEATTCLDWTFPDPSSFEGTYEERFARTRRVRDAIRARIEQWCTAFCPPQKACGCSPH